MDIRAGALDHHPLLLNGIATCLNAAPGITFVGAASEAIAARKLIGHKRPDVFLLDMDVPDEAGLGLARQMRRLFPRVEIIAMAEHPNSAYRHALNGIGVKGYVANTFSPELLVADVVAVAAGETVIAAEATAGPDDDELHGLTSSEVEVLEYVAAGYPTKHIAKTLDVSDRTVEFHLNHVYAKLEVAGRVAAIARAQQLGIIFVPGLRLSTASDLRVSTGPKLRTSSRKN